MYWGLAYYTVLFCFRWRPLLVRSSEHNGKKVEQPRETPPCEHTDNDEDVEARERERDMCVSMPAKRMWNADGCKRVNSPQKLSPYPPSRSIRKSFFVLLFPVPSFGGIGKAICREKHPLPISLSPLSLSLSFTLTHIKASPHILLPATESQPMGKQRRTNTWPLSANEKALFRMRPSWHEKEEDYIDTNPRESSSSSNGSRAPAPHHALLPHRSLGPML